MEFPGQPKESDIKKTEDGRYHATYRQFSVGDAESGYVLHFSGYTGNAGDELRHQNGEKFTTNDKDQDRWSGGNCGMKRKGGFWYSDCGWVKLNGRWQAGDVTGVIWYAITGVSKDLTFVEMKLRML